MVATTICKRNVSVAGAVAAMIMALVLAMTLGAGTASAGGYAKPLNQAVKAKTVKTFYFPGKINKEGNTLYFEGNKSVKVVKYDKKHVKAKAVSANDLQITVKKAGTSKVTIKYGNKKCTLKIKAYKWQFPFKTLKIGGKSYVSKLKKTLYDGWYAYMPLFGCNVQGKQVVASMNPGWKVKFNNGNLKNKGTNDSESLDIQLVHKKTNWNIQFNLSSSQIYYQ